MDAILMDKKKMAGNSVKIRTIWSVKEKRLKMKKKKKKKEMEVGVPLNI